MREHINGVEVIRLAMFIPSRPRQMLQRIWMEGSLSLMAALAMLSRWRSGWDLILYVGSHPSLAMLSRVVATLLRVPYVVKITDFASQLATEVGIVQNRRLQEWLSAFEYAAYRRASGAIVLCDGFRKLLVASGYPAERIRVISNSKDLDLIHPVSAKNGFREANDLLSDEFVVLYAGTWNLKTGLTIVVETARLLRSEHPAVRWVLVGDGEIKPKLQKLIAEYGLTEYVRLLPVQPKNRMSEMFSSADVLLLSQLVNIKDTVIPGKLITYMATGRPVLAAVNSDSQSAVLLRETEGGVIVPPENPGELAAAVRKLRTDPQVLEEMGRRNRQYAEKHFDQRNNLAAQETFLKQVISEAHAVSLPDS